MGDSDMFLGNYSHSFDNKGRLIIPAKYREDIGARRLVVVPWWEKNVAVFPEDEFKNYIESLNRLQGSAETKRRVKRFLLSKAEECRLDAQGRILINQDLRTFAGLEKDVVITGDMDYFEIWNPETWSTMDDDMMNAEEMSSELEGLKMMF